MVDRVVLKRLTEASDLGWFYSIYHNRGLKTNQKGITLNKTIINPIWPNLLVRQSVYETAKQAEKAARAPGGAGAAAAAVEKDKAKAAGHLPIQVEIHGPAGKPPLPGERLMALQDKNWRLNGSFIEDPPGDPTRFDPTLVEGDLALIGFEGVEWPTKAIVVLLAQSTTDATLIADLAPLVTKGPNSMVELTPHQLQTFATKHILPVNHVIRALAGDPVIEAAAEEIAQGDLAAVAKVKKHRPAKPLSADELDIGIEANKLTGRVGEAMVNAMLAEQNAAGGLAYNWMWPVSAAHPYDFELLDGGVADTVIDAKSTSTVWTSDFYMSSAELAHAATSSVPYLIYRLSEVGPTGAWLRISSDIRSFASAAVSAFSTAALPGTRTTTIAISPTASGLTWSNPVRLPPLSP